MHKTSIVLALAAVAAFQVHPVDARPLDHAKWREVRQEARIHQGVRHGDLTRGEAMRLQAGERHIARLDRRAWADGRLGPRERFRVNRALDRQSARIWRLRHNRRSA
jgi:hypothetical protein